MKLILVILMGISLLACGGGSGGSEPPSTPNEPTSPTDPTDPTPPTTDPINPYPNLQPDPIYIGNKIEFDGKNFTLTDELVGDQIKFTSLFKDGSAYVFADDLKHGTRPLFPITLSNEDVILVGTVIEENNHNRFLFGMHGNWAENFSSQSYRYFDEYHSLDANGNQNPSHNIMIELDIDNLQNSHGADLTTGQEVIITFGTRDGIHFSGNIADENSDINPAGFELFGEDANAIAGGYSGEQGVGMLIGVSR